MRWLILITCLGLAACQTTGGQSPSPGSQQGRATQASEHCGGIVVPGSPLWNELHAGGEPLTRCVRARSHDGTLAWGTEAYSKAAPNVKAAGMGRQTAGQIRIHVGRYDSPVKDPQRHIESNSDDGRLIGEAIPATLYSGKVDAYPIIVERHSDGDPYACALAFARGEGGYTSYVLACRTLYMNNERGALALARQIAREDFPYIIP